LRHPTYSFATIGTDRPSYCGHPVVNAPDASAYNHRFALQQPVDGRTLALPVLDGARVIVHHEVNDLDG